MTKKNVLDERTAAMIATAHTTQSVDELRKLTKEGKAVIRVALLERNDVPEEIMWILADDRARQVRVKLAQHSVLPAALMLKLASDESTDVRKSLASREDVTFDVAWLLKDSSPSVREKAAKNPHSPAEVLQYMAEHETKHEVQLFLTTNESTPVSAYGVLSESKEVSVRIAVAKKVDCPPSLLVKLSDDPHDAVVWKVCRNRNTPTDTLLRLSESSNMNTRRYVAQNTKLSASVWEEKTLNPDPKKAYYATVRNKLPVKALENLLRLPPPSDMHAHQLIAQEKITHFHLVGYLYSHDNLSDALVSQIAVKLARSPEITFQEAEKLNRFPRLNGYARDKVLVLLLKNPDLTVEQLEDYAQYNSQVRSIILNRLMGTTKYAGYPYEWLEAALGGMRA